MSIGLGMGVGLWVISGVAFWIAFVALGLRFRPAYEPDHAPAPALDEPNSTPSRPRAAPDHVLTRSWR